MRADYDGRVSEAPPLPGIEGGLVSATAGAGALFPQGRLAAGWFDDVHGAGWRLVTVAADELDADLVAWFATIGGEVVDVAATAPDLVAWFDAHDTRWALQRPDFYLFGTARDAGEAEALLRVLRDRLTEAA
jgi:hypothetical protein